MLIARLRKALAEQESENMRAQLQELLVDLQNTLED